MLTGCNNEQPGEKEQTCKSIQKSKTLKKTVDES